MIKYIRMFVALARPPALFLFASFGALGLAVAGEVQNQWLLAKVVVAVVGFVMMSVVVNDLADERIDRVNFASSKNARPLVAGTATRPLFVTVAVASGATGLAASALLGLAPFAVVAAGVALSLAYSVRPIRLSDRGALTSLLLPFGYVAVPFLTGFFSAGAAFTSSTAIILGGVYIGFIGRILLKDFRDVRGDALFGKRTFVVRYGRRTTCAASAVCLFVGNVALVGVRAHTVALLTANLALTATTIWLLFRLAREGGARRDEWIISAIAILGRGMVVSLLAHVSLAHAAVGGVAYTFVIVGLAVATLQQAHRMVSCGPRFGKTVPAEWTVDTVLETQR